MPPSLILGDSKMIVKNKDFHKFPKFRHNLWTKHQNKDGLYYLVVSNGIYEVPESDAEDFLQIRSHCTGYNTIEKIAKESNYSKKRVGEIVSSLSEADILHLPVKHMQEVTQDNIRNTLLDAVRIWRDQLAETHIVNDIINNNVDKNVLTGWLLESYHYVKNFPSALYNAYENCDDETFKPILYNYYQQECGHEIFVLRCLLKLGLSEAEVKNSIPLVSTRLIDLLLKELFCYSPYSVLLIASVIEASEFDIDSAQDISSKLNKHYGVPLDLLDSYFTHIKVDVEMGHEKLLKENIDYIDKISADKIHEIVNKIHDIKHAFDVQKLEIKDYYSHKGNYMPRQYVDFFAI